MGLNCRAGRWQFYLGVVSDPADLFALFIGADLYGFRVREWGFGLLVDRSWYEGDKSWSLVCGPLLAFVCLGPPK